MSVVFDLDIDALQWVKQFDEFRDRTLDFDETCALNQLFQEFVETRPDRLTFGNAMALVLFTSDMAYTILEQSWR